MQMKNVPLKGLRRTTYLEGSVAATIRSFEEIQLRFKVIARFHTVLGTEQHPSEDAGMFDTSEQYSDIFTS